MELASRYRFILFFLSKENEKGKGERNVINSPSLFQAFRNPHNLSLQVELRWFWPYLVHQAAHHYIFSVW